MKISIKKRKMYPITYFFRKNWLRCFMAIVYLIFMAVVSVRDVTICNEEATFELCWFESFCGNLELSATNADKFELPVLWIIFQALILYIISDYLHDSGKGIGLQRLFRINNRRKWYMQVCITGVLMIVLYYIFYFGILLLVTKMQLIPFIFSIEQKDIFRYIITCFVLPICCTITIFLLQNLISLYYATFISYILSLGLLIVSVYWKMHFLFGNYAMLLRTSFYRTDGLDVSLGLGICIATSVAVLCLSLIKIKKIDFIEKELEEL